MYPFCELCCLFFFFKQKTAYEMRISDWSSDVCSSDLLMAIPESQLETWAKQGSVTQSKDTYATIKAALEDSNAPYRTRDYSIRSEEHTSELQSLMRISYAVFCLKKKKKNKNKQINRSEPEVINHTYVNTL